jgi:hypothetical protein
MLDPLRVEAVLVMLVDLVGGAIQPLEELRRREAVTQRRRVARC